MKRMTVSRTVCMRRAWECVFLGLMLLTAGCASFQGNELSSVTNFPAVQTKKTIDVNLAFSASLNGAPITTGNEMARQRLAKKCVERLKQSGLFSDVSENLANPDLKVDVNVEDVGEGSMAMAALTGLTLYVVPSKARDTYRLSAKVTDMKSGKKAEIKLEDSITQWQQIFLLPLLPFKSTIAEANTCQNKLFDNLALEIQKTGMLD